jgi:hypothetical protein
MILSRTTNSIATANRVPYYAQAFAGEFDVIWGDTPYAPEIENMTYLRAITAFVGEASTDIEARRQLLYYYASEFKKSSKDDSINRYYNQLPIKSILKRFLNEVCTSYSKPITRVFADANGREYNETFERYYNDFNTTLKTAYKIARGCGVAAVRPVVIPTSDGYRVRLQALYPDEFRVKTHTYDATLVESICYPVASAKQGNVKTYTRSNDTTPLQFEFVEFTSDAVNRYDSKFQLLQTEPNPYARIPFVFLRLDDGEGFYGKQEFDLVEGSLNANKLQFQSNVSIAFTSSPLWLALNMGASADNIIFSPDAIHAIDGVTPEDFPPQIEAVRPDSPFRDLEELQAERTANALKNAGLPSSVVEGGTVLSGVSRMIERLPLTKMQEEDENRLQAFENELLQALMRVLAVDARAIMPSQPITVSVQFDKESLIDSPKDSYELDRQKFTDGVLSPREFFNRYSTTQVITDEEAISMMRSANTSQPTTAETLTTTEILQ